MFFGFGPACLRLNIRISSHRSYRRWTNYSKPYIHLTYIHNPPLPKFQCYWCLLSMAANGLQFKKKETPIDIMFKMCLNIPSSTQPLHNNQILQSFYPQLPRFRWGATIFAKHLKQISGRSPSRPGPQPVAAERVAQLGQWRVLVICKAQTWTSCWLNQPIWKKYDRQIGSWNPRVLFKKMFETTNLGYTLDDLDVSSPSIQSISKCFQQPTIPLVAMQEMNVSNSPALQVLHKNHQRSLSNAGDSRWWWWNTCWPMWVQLGTVLPPCVFQIGGVKGLYQL